MAAIRRAVRQEDALKFMAELEKTKAKLWLETAAVWIHIKTRVTKCKI